MRRFFIGDLQGCLEPLERLLDELRPGRDDELLFAGDLVNRGPDSLGCLRRVYALAREGRARVVLGNHDLHLLARSVGAPRAEDDTLDEILSAPDGEELLRWLRAQPLLLRGEDWLLVHAGLKPSWTLPTAAAAAEQAAEALQRPGALELLAAARREKSLLKEHQWLKTIRWLTRVRFVSKEGRFKGRFKGPPEEAPEGLEPWYHSYARWASAQQGVGALAPTVLFGHWAALGFSLDHHHCCLDSGCVWGESLSALAWPARERIAVSASP